MRKTLPLSCFFILMLTTSRLIAQNPTAPALGFNVFVQGSATLISNETDGPVAMGGNLNVGGAYNASVNSAGTFTRSGIPVSLVVGGRVNYNGGTLTVNQNGYVKMGDCTGSAVWYTDMSGHGTSPIRITPGSDYDDTPRVNMVVSSSTLGVGGGINPVCEASVIDFASAFAQMQTSSTTLAALSDNANLTDAIGDVIAHTGLPAAVDINLHTGVNVLNISGSDLNAVNVFAFNNAADAGHILIVNVNAPGAFTWQVYNSSGAALAQSAYILYNFYNATSINIAGTNAVEGTIFAPFADITKTINPSVIEGQIIGHSYYHSSGDDHYCCFNPSVPGCGGGGIPTEAYFDINNTVQCLSCNVFIFLGGAVGVGPFTYHWNFGDGTTASTMDYVKSYSAAGTYTVTLIATSSTGSSDTVHHVVTVEATPVSGFTVNNSVQYLTGNNFICTSTIPTTGNTYHWDFGDGSTSTAVNPSHTYASVGGYVITQEVTGVGGCTINNYDKVFVTCDSVTGGGHGGLESVSLGDAVSRRVINNVKNSVSSKTDYNACPDFHKGGHEGAARTTALGSTIERFVPETLDPSTVAKITTPTDIVSLTSAKDVFSVDYENNNNAKAVVLAITTLGAAYNHTKSICDRFRGATLLATEMVQVHGYNFIQFTLKQTGGEIEYCIAFAAGKSASSSHFDLQSKWLISEYTGDDSVFNFQVWAASPVNTQKLTDDILTNLAAVLPLQQIDNNLTLPPTYIAAGKRNKGFLNLSLTSNVNTANAKIIFEENRNEFSGTDTLEIPFTLVAGTANNFSIPIYDGYQYEGHLYLNDTLTDDVYMADGNWSLDIDAGTQVTNYKPDNNFTRVYVDGEYPLYRNATLKGTSDDYASIWKFVTSGKDAVDLTSYNSFKFLAKGIGKVQIRLIKAGVVNWADQYYTTLELDSTGTTNYQISLQDFTSDHLSTPFVANDVTAVVYTFEYTSSTNVNFFVDNQAFSPTVVTSVKALESKKITVMPNPASGPFQCKFAADQSLDMTLELTDISGRVLYKQDVQAVSGMNTVNVNVPAEIPSGMLFMRMGNKNVKYDVTKITFAH